MKKIFLLCEFIKVKIVIFCENLENRGKCVIIFWQQEKKLRKGLIIMTRKISVIYKLLTVLSLLTGVTLNLLKTTSAVSLLSYYTSQSNIICLVAFICYLVMEIKEKDGKYRRSDVYFLLKGAIVMAIFITATFYHIALAPIGFDMESLHRTTIIKKIANFFVHTCSPCMVILDYFLFDEKGRFKKYYPLVWLFIPFNYVVYVYNYAAHGGKFFGIGGSTRFAYFFLDYIELGVFGVIKWLTFMALGVFAVSYLLVWIDRILGKRRKDKKEDG